MNSRRRFRMAVLLSFNSVARCGRRRPVIHGIGIALQKIPAGEFPMGSEADEKERAALFQSEGPRHLIRITRPFYLGRTSVTVGQFAALVKALDRTSETAAKGGSLRARKNKAPRVRVVSLD